MNEYVREIITDMRGLSLAQAIVIVDARIGIDDDAWISSRGASLDAVDAMEYPAEWAEEFAAAWHDLVGAPVVTEPIDVVAVALWEACAGATVAVETRHLIGRHGYTWEDYARLTGPLVRGLGHRLHPEDDV